MFSGFVLLMFIRIVQNYRYIHSKQCIDICQYYVNKLVIIVCIILSCPNHFKS